jgi:hypothetical protein
VPVDRKGRAGQRRRAQRIFVHPLPGIGEAAAVAREHLDIGQHVMAEGDRLRGLQMGEARHDGCGMRFGLFRQRRCSSFSAHPAIDGVADIEPEISATWSLRERAVCSRPAAGPITSFSRDSTFMWMSSSAREKVKFRPRSRP